MDEKLLKKARPHYFALKKALLAAVKDLGAAETIGMVTTTMLRLHTDDGRPAVLTLGPMAASLAENVERVSFEDMEQLHQVFIALRKGDAEALAALTGADAATTQALLAKLAETPGSS